MINQELVLRAAAWLARVECLGYAFSVREAHGGVVLQASYLESDVYGGPDTSPVRQQTRKWLLSPEMTESEVVQTALKCVLTSMEHRAREHFKYCGVRVFGPHLDVRDLMWLAETKGDNQGARKK